KAFSWSKIMTRKKVKLAYITNDSARKATYKKRKKGLIKKVSELSTLCDIQACAIVYSPYDTQPEIWPPTLAGVHQVLSRFRKVPQLEQSKKMVNQEKFLAERIRKAGEQLRKQKRDNEEKMVNNAVFECLTGRISLTSLTLGDLDVIARAVDQQIKDVDRRLVEIARRAGKGVAGAGAGKGVTGAGAGGSSSAAAPTNGVNLEGEVRSLQMIPMTDGGNDGGGVAVASGRAEYKENMDSLQRQLWYMEMMNNNSAAALAQTAVPVATEQQMAAGYMGAEMMMMNGATAAATATEGSSGGGEFGEGSSSNWVGNNGAPFGNYNNNNGFWAGNNHFYQ
ncbi:Agamous-like MADS-box protein AGL80, partial [Linum grandiflorum]